MIKPTMAFVSFKDITVEFLKKNNIDAILLDVDNTVSPPSSKKIYDGVEEWLDEIKKSGIEVIICSNNFRKRVYPFAKSVGLDCVAMSLKPLPFGFIRAEKKLSVKPKNALVIGDQIFTDIIGANLAGIRSILVEPIDPHEEIQIVLKRYLEKPIICLYKLKNKNSISKDKK